jgi:hypothetical protein
MIKMITEKSISRPAAPGDAGMLHGSADERAEAIAQRCGGGCERRGSWTVSCPAHEDHDPSLTITATGDKVLLHCFAGCEVVAICAAIGITVEDLFADDLPRSRSHAKPVRLNRTQPPDNIPLQFAVSFTIDDPSMLDIAEVRQVFAHAHSTPIERLWVERELFRHGMNAQTVWQTVVSSGKSRTLRKTLRRSLP